MEHQNNDLPFPFEFQDLKPKDKAELDRLYKTDTDFIVVGPKKYVLRREYVKDAASIYNLHLRPGDIFVNTSPRSGTTWTQELVWLIANGFDYTAAQTRFLHSDRFTFLERFTLFGDKWQKQYLENAEDKEKALQVIENLCIPESKKLQWVPSPRFIKSHLPMSLLPPNLLDTAKVVYVARDPRDVAVSAFYFIDVLKALKFTGSFKEFWNIFFKNLHTHTPIFEHVKEAWALRNHPNMLFLFYEELIQNLPETARRVAHFLGKVVTDEQITRLCEHLHFDNFKKNESVNLQNSVKAGLVNNDTFIRKGKAGGWRVYFDEEMTQQAEKWISENLKDTDLRYPHMQA